MNGAVATPEDRALQQRMTALGNANNVRTKRKELKAKIKAREVAAADLILNPPEWLQTAKVTEFLMWIPGLGPARSVRVAREVFGIGGIPKNLTIGRLSSARRISLARAVNRVRGAVPSDFAWDE